MPYHMKCRIHWRAWWLVEGLRLQHYTGAAVSASAARRRAVGAALSLASSQNRLLILIQLYVKQISLMLILSGTKGELRNSCQVHAHTHLSYTQL